MFPSCFGDSEAHLPPPSLQLRMRSRLRLSPVTPPSAWIRLQGQYLRLALMHDANGWRSIDNYTVSFCFQLDGRINLFLAFDATRPCRCYLVKLLILRAESLATAWDGDSFENSSAKNFVRVRRLHERYPAVLHDLHRRVGTLCLAGSTMVLGRPQ